MGIDCVGLIVCTLRAEGLEISDTTSYRRHADWAKFMEKFIENGHWIGDSVAVAEPGDILVLMDGKYQTHCAFVADLDGVLTIIHAYEPYGKVIEERLSPEIASRIRAVFIPEGLSYDR